ncbi:MAG: two-component regulator propeller domain-containing protein [Bacteroidales bacterium]
MSTGFCLLKADPYPGIRFHALSPDLLPSNEVRKLYQDSDGYLWIPTYNGLARFDGHDVITYGVKDVSNGLFNTFVNVVSEDLEKNLWIGTELGIFRLDKLTGNMYANEFPELSDCNISVIVCETNGDLWVGGNKGLYRKKKYEYHFQLLDINNSTGNPLMSITSVIKDDKLNLWIAAFDQGLIRYNLREERAYYYDDPVLRYAHVLSCGQNGDIWVGTWGAGLVRLLNPYSIEPVRYIRYQHKNGDENSLLDDIIYAIEENPEDNTLWIGSRSGLSILHDIHDTGSFQNFRPGENIDELPYNEVNSILQGNDGLMWIGMLGGGVCKISTVGSKFENKRLESIKQRYNTSAIQCLYSAGNGNYWLGLLDFGLIKYNVYTDEIIDYHEHPHLKELPYTSTVNTIIRREKTDELYFGTQNAGIWIYNEKTGRVRQINRFTNQQFQDDCVITQCEDSMNNIWIGTRSGVYIETPEKEFYCISEWLGSSSPLDLTRIYDICSDKSGNVWIATNGYGVIRIMLSDRTWHQYTDGQGMTANRVYCLESDEYGGIWAGTAADGLAVYVPGEDHFKSVSAFPNLESKGITNIIREQNGRMWITTNNSAYSFSPDREGTPLSINSNIISGQIQSFFINHNAAVCLDDNQIVFGGSNGLLLFSGSIQQVHKSSLPVVFTDFKVHNQSLRKLPVRERSEISVQDIDYTNSLILNHRQNNFSFEFALLSYSNSRNHIFRYKLDKYDKDYVTVDSHHRYASYSNLPAGTYIFYLQGADENGIWCNNERKVQIRILPAPWLSWWAWSIYVLLFGILIYGGIRFIFYRIQLRHEVHISNLERQKIEELNHLKLQFFTNATHELMTPLTIIMASLQNLHHGTGDIQLLYGVMSTNATRLMRLIQQLLEFRKVESGNMKIRVSCGEIVSFVRQCIEAFAPLIANKRLHVYFNCPLQELWGWYDSDKLDKIIYNLLSNAAKYTPEEGEITISIESGNDGSVCLSVTNRGALMSQETMANLFKRFYDGNYREFNTIGTGIGLSLVKDLVDLHKGTIDVSSTLESGNCFRVKIPFCKDTYTQDQIDERSSNSTNQFYPNKSISEIIPRQFTEIIPGGIGKSDNPTYTLLIVDDNEELRLLVSNLLLPYFHIETAENGEEALLKLNRSSIDLVVSDIMMPGIDGIELCRKIKSTLEYCHIPVILLTAKNAIDSHIEGYNSGADGYITKPFNLQLLYAQITNQLMKLENRGSKFRTQLVFEVDKLEYTSLDEAFMQQAMNCVNAHIDDCNFSQTDFTREMNVSRTILTEKIKSLTGLTPTAFIIDVRLRAAYTLLEEQQKMRIADLAFASGFSDPKYFSTCFRKKFGMSPKEFMNQLKEKGEKVIG